MKKDIREITYGAMTVAITCTILLLDRFLVGIVDSILFWLIPIPLIIYILLFSFKAGLMTGIALILASFIIVSLPVFLLVMFSVLSAWMYGLFIKRSSTIITILMTTLSSILYYVVAVYFLSELIFGYNLLLDASELQEMLNLFGFVVSETLALNLTQVVMPTVILILSFLQTLVLHFAVILLCQRLNIKIKIGNLSLLRIKQSHGIIALILVLIFGVGFYSVDNIYLKSTFLALMAVLILLFLYYGFLLVNMFFRLKQVKFAIIIEIVLLIIFPYVIIVLGIGEVLFQLSTKIQRSSND